jgi:leucyl aminopeptidase
MIRLTAEQNTLLGTRADILAYLIFADTKVRERQFKELQRQIPGIRPALERGAFSGKEGETLTLYPGRGKARALMLVGVGKMEKLNCERFRRAAAAAAKSARSLKARTLALFEPDPAIIREAATDCGRHPWEQIGAALGEGAHLSLYRFDKYITSEQNTRTSPNRITVVSTHRGRAAEIRAGLSFAQVVSDATWLARDLSNAPGSEIYPQSLATAAVHIGRKNGFRVRVFNERAIDRMNMGGLLAVAQGSDRPPRFILLEYNNRPRLRTIVLVGKGVTFDAGGISIKPASGMAEMRMDMSGAAAVIGTFQTAAQLKLPVHLIGLVPATENLLGGSAMKPGDILRHHNGKTSEVDNTDAEGRLILADALSYAARFKPSLVVDLATLTGACVVALGHVATGMMGNDQNAMDQLRRSGERTYERVWQLPMFDEYEKLVKSDVADVKNVGGRWGGAITAAMFLKKFVGNYKWIHLDIAGTAILEESQDYISKGASGVGVRLLADFLRNWAG